MLERLKKMRTLPALAFLLVFLTGAAAERAELFVNGELKRTFTDFQMVEGAVFLPLKEASSALEIQGFADSRSKAMFFRTGSSLLVIDSDKKKLTVGMKSYDLSHPPIWTPDQVYVPREVFTEHLAREMDAVIHVAAVDSAGRLVAGSRPLAEGGIETPALEELDALRNPVDVIVIDPGHGGDDYGASGPGGVKEKDVTLAISKRLKDRLSKVKGLEVHLTRSDDEYIKLGDRPKKARKLEADVFVSIHANGYKMVSTEGFETFFASLTATDQAAMDLARWENQVDVEGTENPDEVMTDIEMILGDMAQTESLAASQHLAEMIQDELATVMASDNRGVKQAPFHVLMKASMPAVLIEVGFLTSPKEAKHITDEATQGKIVAAIASAILKYREQTNARLGLSQ